MDRLARLIHRRRRLVLASTVVFVLFAVAYGGPVVSLLDSDDDFEDHGSESVLARDAVERATGRSASPDMVVLVRLGAPVDSPEAQEKIARVAQQLEHPDVADVVAVRDGEPAELVSRDGRSTHLLAIFGTDADDDELAEEAAGAAAGARAGRDRGRRPARVRAGRRAGRAGPRCAQTLSFSRCSSCSRSVFRSVVAALLPVLVGATTIITTFVWMRLVNEVEPMSVFAINLTTGAGLGLAIDYSRVVVALCAGAGHWCGHGRGAAADDEDGGPHGALQRGHGRGGDGRPDRVRPALPVRPGATAACWWPSPPRWSR